MLTGNTRLLKLARVGSHYKLELLETSNDIIAGNERILKTGNL